jgi:hypothetical protein
MPGLLVLAGLVFIPAVVRSAPPIEFELATEPGFPLTGAQSWVSLFSKLGESSIRIRQARSGDRVDIEELGGKSAPAYYRVRGLLTSHNRLRLPGGEFGLSDRTKIEAWIKKLREDGASGPTARTSAFGLTDEQLVAFHDKLSAPIRCTTKGRRCGDVARDIVQGLLLEYTVSDTARQAFREGEVFADDLKTLSHGTALAAVVRPLGLVIRPEKQPGGVVRLLICGVRETPEAWPIGWPPQDIPAQVAPKLFEYLKVTITNRSLADALGAIQPRVEVPFLLDYNSLARSRIEIDKVKVTYAKERATYQSVLQNLILQSGLTSELRVDEAGQPFLWIGAR